jgi:hypothetical protein
MLGQNKRIHLFNNIEHRCTGHCVTLPGAGGVHCAEQDRLGSILGYYQRRMKQQMTQLFDNYVKCFKRYLQGWVEGINEEGGGVNFIKEIL